MIQQLANKTPPAVSNTKATRPRTMIINVELFINAV
jgi:hypothetical protein